MKAWVVAHRGGERVKKSGLRRRRGNVLVFFEYRGSVNRAVHEILQPKRGKVRVKTRFLHFLRLRECAGRLLGTRPGPGRGRACAQNGMEQKS